MRTLSAPRLIPQVEPDHALAVRMSLLSNLPSHAPLSAWPRVTHGARRGCVRRALPGCASPVLAIGGAHLLSTPRSRAGPVGAAQSDRVPEMPSRRLVASAVIRPIAKLPVRSLCRRHLHPYPCRLPSRSEPVRCRLLCDFAHAPSRGEALKPLAPGKAAAVRCGRTTRRAACLSQPHPEIESRGSASFRCAKGRRHGAGVSLSPPGLVTFHG